MSIIKNMPVKMSADVAASVIADLENHPKDAITEATATLLHHMRLQDTRISLLEKALEDTGREMVRARIAACHVLEPSDAQRMTREEASRRAIAARANLMTAKLAGFQGHPGDDRTNWLKPHPDFTEE